MPRKYLIVLFFLAFAPPLAGQGAAFADSYTQDGKPCPPECVSDSMEIVTWYPSPYNEYEELRLYPKRSAEESQCNSFEQLGLMYYNQDQQALKVCWQDPQDLSYSWKDVTLGGGYWQLSGNDIFNANSGKVGIGTTTPDSTVSIGNDRDIEWSPLNKKLHIHEDSAGGDQIAITTTYPPGRTGAFLGVDNNSLFLLKAANGLPILSAAVSNWAGRISGNIGIGTTDPQYKLDVGGGTIGNAKINQGGCYWTPWADWSNGPQICAAGYYVAGQNQKDCGNWHDCESLYCCHP